jgi:DNA repair protein RAD51
MSKSKKKQTEVIEEEEDIIEETETESVKLIGLLENEGISASDIDKLKKDGFYTIDSILSCPKKNLLLVKGISEAKADKIIAAAAKLGGVGFQTATEYNMKRKDIIHLTTGSKELDKFLFFYITFF